MTRRSPAIIQYLCISIIAKSMWHFQGKILPTPPLEGISRHPKFVGLNLCGLWLSYKFSHQSIQRWVVGWQTNCPTGRLLIYMSTELYLDTRQQNSPGALSAPSGTLCIRHSSAHYAQFSAAALFQRHSRIDLNVRIVGFCSSLVFGTVSNVVLRKVVPFICC